MTQTTAPPAVAGGRTRLARWQALLATVAAGIGLLVSFPPYGLWWCAPPAVAALAVAVRGRGPWAGGGLGWLAGGVFFVPLLSWTGTQVGWWPWLLLAGFQGLYLGVLGAATAAATPLFSRHPWSWPPMVALLWVAQETLRSQAPFGGFPWGRLAFSQADAPSLRYAALGGAPLVTLAVGLAGGLLAVSAWRRSTRSLLAVAGAAGVFGLAAAVPLPAPDAGRAVEVAIIQGNVPRLGLDFNAQRRAVLDNHVAATLSLAADVDAGRRPRPDLVVWPENASDIDPFVNADARAAIDRAARAVDAPLLVGAVLVPESGGVRNTAVLWLPDTGPDQRYTKRHPVPFAEYIPLRPFVRTLTSKVDLVRSDFVAGDSPGVITVPAAGGAVTVGDVICFEVAYDGLVRDTVTGGAQLLVTQTNNATFDAAEARQQLAMVRLRSVEHGRAGLMASTVGVSAFVDSHGRAHAVSGFDTRAVLTRRTHLTTARTPATTLGNAPEVILTGLALFGLIIAAGLRWRGRAPHTLEEEA